jgi:hypothetical protein
MRLFDPWPVFFKREFKRTWPFLVGFAVTGTLITKFTASLTGIPIDHLFFSLSLSLSLPPSLPLSPWISGLDLDQISQSINQIRSYRSNASSLFLSSIYF